MLFEGKVAVITGAANGIGRATARAFARDGASVVVADIDDDAGRATVELVTDDGGTAIYCHADMLSEHSVREMVTTTVARFGRLDCAVNNAGHPGFTTDVVACTEEEWELVMDLNVRSVRWCMKYEIPAMLETGGGAIVNVSSGSGLFASPRMASYITAKHAVLGLSRSAAIDFAAKGIRVNTLHPGSTATTMLLGTAEALKAQGLDVVTDINARNPMKRLGLPEEQGEAAAWLCSERASFVNGASLVVDGGLSSLR